MKKLEISKLMDEYVDNEFFPEGGSSANVETVKDKVLAKSAPSKKRRVPVKWLLLAAALTATLIVTAAAVPLMKTYPLYTGGTLEADVVTSGPNRHIYCDLEAFPEDPLVLENGRLWMVLNGQRTDITDYIDEETPYIIDYTDPENGLKSSLILGGTPEDFGWMFWQELPNGGGYVGDGYNHATEYFTIDGVTYAIKRGDHSLDDSLFSKESENHEIVYKSWCVKGESEAKVFGRNG